jgi:hypothetical protein
LSLMLQPAPRPPMQPLARTSAIQDLFMRAYWSAAERCAIGIATRLRRPASRLPHGFPPSRRFSKNTCQDWPPPSNYPGEVTERPGVVPG